MDAIDSCDGVASSIVHEEKQAQNDDGDKQDVVDGAVVPASSSATAVLVAVISPSFPNLPVKEEDNKDDDNDVHDNNACSLASSSSTSSSISMSSSNSSFSSCSFASSDDNEGADNVLDDNEDRGKMLSSQDTTDGPPSRAATADSTGKDDDVAMKLSNNLTSSIRFSSLSSSHFF